MAHHLTSRQPSAKSQLPQFNGRTPMGAQPLGKVPMPQLQDLRSITGGKSQRARLWKRTNQVPTGCGARRQLSRNLNGRPGGAPRRRGRLKPGHWARSTGPGPGPGPLRPARLERALALGPFTVGHAHWARCCRGQGLARPPGFAVEYRPTGVETRAPTLSGITVTRLCGA